MAFTYYLPTPTGTIDKKETEFNSVIIIGANGSGKSKLGAWMEQQNMMGVHRIGGQRNLNFRENIPLQNYTQAEEAVLYGRSDLNNETLRATKFFRWKEGKQYTTTLLDDFEDVLAALIALTHNENMEYIDACKQAERDGKEKPATTKSALDKLIDVWNKIFPQRKLQMEDSRFITFFEKNGKEVKYSSDQMSDGERAVLYLTAQILCVPEKKTLIIDEPELHLHRTIMNRLWHALENCRPDCLFIYITHDTEFASLHGASDKIWIKEYDGKNWELSKIEEADLPEDLLFDILGSRKNVLFVEGESSSYDTQLYSVIYSNYHVVACGGCSQVISRTKAFRNCQALHDCKVYGIIDRDYRSDREIEKYKKDNIYVLEVAEVENLFLVEELIKEMSTALGEDPEKVYKEVKRYIVQQRFSREINKQICQSVVANLKYCLSVAELSQKNEREAKASLDVLFQSLDYEQIETIEGTRFRNALDSDDYKQVLRVFNEKNLVSSVGTFFGIKNDAYCNKVIALLRGEKHDAIIAAIAPYLPSEIQR